MEAKCKTHRFLEVVLLVLWISGCAAESPDYTDPVEIGTKSVTLPSKHSLLDAVADRIFDGEKAGDYYSAWVRARGDLNGDDYADIVIGAPNHNNFRGRVYIYFGGKDVSSVADLILTGETPDARLGQCIDMGDVNNDNYDDLVVGACGYNNKQGRVKLYYGGPDFNGTADKVFYGEPGTAYGFGLRTILGDVNGDSCADLAIQAYNYNYDQQGRVYLYYGATGENMDTTCDLIFDAETSGTQAFGRSMVIGQDIDGDVTKPG